MSQIRLRQGFTGYEKDQETGLHFAQARYYAGAQGRFTSCDPLIISTQHSANPQRWNAYTYVLNSPLGMSDPNGRNGKGSGGGRVIDVFITLSNREQKQVKMNWRGLERMADKLRREGKRDVTLNLYTADANQVNNKRVENSLSTPGRFTVIVGHSLNDSGHPAGKGGQGVDIGNGYIGSHGVTTVNPNGDHELGPIKAAAFFAVSCYPGEGFIRNVTKSLTKGSVAYYNSGGTEDGKTSIDAGEKAGFEIVKALILGQSPDEAAGAGQTVLNASEDPQDQDGESIVTIYPPDDRLDRR